MAGLDSVEHKTSAKELWAVATLPLPALLTALFGLHTLLLMGTGAWSDLAMAGDDFVQAQYLLRIGVLAAGFLLYGVLARRVRSRASLSKAIDVLGIVLSTSFVSCDVVARISDHPAVRMSAVYAIALIIGLSGGMVYERIALLAPMLEDELPRFRGRLGDSSHALGLVVGIGGASAVVLQFVLQFELSLWAGLDAGFIFCFGLLMWLVRMTCGVESASSFSSARDESDGPHRDPSSTSGLVSPMTNRGQKAFGSVPLACVIVAAICLTIPLVFFEAMMYVPGAVTSFYEWQRLVSAMGYAVIGMAAYLGGLPAASVSALVLSLFGVVVSVQTAALEVGPLTIALFYVLVMVMLAWRLIAFMAAAPHSSRPALVASMGRILMVLEPPEEFLAKAAGELSMMAVLTGSLALLAVAVLAMARGGLLTFAEPSAAGDAPSREGEVQGRALDQSDQTELSERKPESTPEERVRLLALECGLTDREGEVLAALVLTEKKNQQIADDMHISRRQLQTHISRIYQKTGVATRAGLAMRVNG